MITSWTSCTIQDLQNKGEAELKTGPFGTQLHASDYVETGTPVINVRNIGFGEIREEKLEFIAEETVQRLSSHLLEPGDIVFGRKGAVERHAFINPKYTRWFQGSDCLRLRVKSPSVDSRFLSYYFLTEHHKQWMINQCSHGATMASLNQAIISRIPLLLPSIHTQRKIISILSAYDDLIENNTRRIEILEEMARSLYREWFVNFRFPGHEQVKMVDSELGLIPEGWEIKKLGEVADINKASIKTGDAPEGINYIDISSVSTGKIDKIEPITFSKASSRARRIVKHGDIIWATVRPNRKSYSLILNPIQDLIVSTGFAVITGRKAPYTYLYQTLTTDDFVGYLTNNATGSAYPAVNTGDFKNADVLIPRSELMDEFQNIVADIFNEKDNFLRKNANLRQTRDLLLPKIISGNINLQEIDINIKMYNAENN
jgi:type I restriction enzyme S subunit